MMLDILFYGFVDVSDNSKFCYDVQVVAIPTILYYL